MAFQAKFEVTFLLYIYSKMSAIIEDVSKENKKKKLVLFQLSWAMRLNITLWVQSGKKCNNYLKC